MAQLHDEATRLLTVYNEYKDSTDELARRKVHVDLDRFLMENRELAITLMIAGLKAKPEPWYKRLQKGGGKLAKYNS